MGGDVLMTAVERILAMRRCGDRAKETDQVVLAPRGRELFRPGEDSPLPWRVSPRYSSHVTGDEVRRIRERLRLTQADLARALGVTRVTVARWETGVYAIPEPTARLLQRVRKERRRAKRSR